MPGRQPRRWGIKRVRSIGYRALDIINLAGKLVLLAAATLLAIAASIRWGGAVISYDGHKDVLAGQLALYGSSVAVLGCVLVLTSWHYTYTESKYRLDIKTAPDSDLKRYAMAMETLDDTLSPDEFLMTVRATILLKSFTRRATEQVEFGDTTLRRKLVRTLTVPKTLEAGGTWCVPVHRHQKGQLINQLSLEVDSRPIRSLGHTLNVAMSLEVVGWCYAQSLRNMTREAKENATILLKPILQCIASPAPTSSTEDFQDALSDVIQYWRSSAKTANHAESASDLPSAGLEPPEERFVRIANYLADNYIVFGTVHIPSTLSPFREVSLATTVVEPREDIFRGISNRVRQLLGIPSYRFVVDIASALEADTYHLRGKAPHGTYLYAGSVNSEEQPIAKVRPAAESPWAASARAIVSPTYGSGVVHAYCRDLGRTLAPYTRAPEDLRRLISKLWIDVEFRPTPPGLSGPVTILALYLTLITSAVAIHHDKYFGGVDFHWVTILLVLPSAMCGWLATRFDAQAIRVATPSLVLEFLSLIVVSLGAVGIAVAKLSEGKHQRLALAPFPGRLGRHFEGHANWWTISVLSLSLSIVCVVSFMSRYARYRRALNRGI